MKAIVISMIIFSGTWAVAKSLESHTPKQMRPATKLEEGFSNSESCNLKNRNEIVLASSTNPATSRQKLFDRDIEGKK